MLCALAPCREIRPNASDIMRAFVGLFLRLSRLKRTKFVRIGGT